MKNPVIDLIGSILACVFFIILLYISGYYFIGEKIHKKLENKKEIIEKNVEETKRYDVDIYDNGCKIFTINDKKNNVEYIFFKYNENLIRLK